MPTTSRSPNDNASLLTGLTADQAETVRRFIDERDTLLLLHGSLHDVEREASLEDRLRVFVRALQQTGFARVVLTLRNERMDAELLVTAGLSPEEERELREQAAPGAVWQRRLRMLEPFRISQSYYLDGRDPLIGAEFGGGLRSSLMERPDSEWTPRDSLLVLLRSREGRVLATLSLDDPVDRQRPSLSRIRIVELFAQQMAWTIEQAQLVELAERRAARLHQLQEVGHTLARSLDAGAIHAELTRQVLRVLPGDGAVLALPDLSAGTLRIHQQRLGNAELPPRTVPLGKGGFQDVARSGRPLLVADYAGVRAPDDPLEMGSPCGSALFAPMRVGARLHGVIAVRAAREAAFAPEDEEMLAIIASHAATALANAEQYAESERERRQSEALAEVARAVSESLRLGEVLHLILRHTTALLRAEGAAISLQDGRYLQVVAAVGSASTVAGMHLPIESSVSGRVLQTMVPAIVNDVETHPGVYRPTQQVANVKKALTVPLITGTGAIGVLTVVNRESDFGDDDARVLQRLADHVAVAIVNARLFEEAADATREWRVSFDAIPLGMVVVDAAGRILRSNANAAPLAGLTDGTELVGLEFHEAVLGLSAGEAPDSPLPAAIGGETRRAILRAARDRLLAVTASPHPNGGAVVAFEDVTTLHALEQRYRSVIETSADAIVITDLARRIAFANPAAHELLGYGPELIGMSVRDFVPPELQEFVEGQEDRAFTGWGQRYESQVIAKDGDRRIVAITSAPLRELGRITGSVATLHDVTEERRARNALAQSEARYRNLFESATDAIYTLDPAGTITSANEASCRLAGMSREELLGRSVKRFFPDPETLREVRGHFRAALTGESRRYECEVTVQGGRRTVSITNTPIRHDRRVVGVLGILRDVTEERAQARALALSEARYTDLVEAAADAIFTVDTEGRFTSVNRALEQSTGRSRDELLGTSFADLLAPQDRAIGWPILAATLRGERKRGEFRYRGREGVMRYGSIVTAPLVEAGRVTGGLGVVRDVTEEKLLIEQLLQQEARRAARIVSNLLTFARQHPPTRSLTDLNQVLRDTIALRRYVHERDGVVLHEELDPDLPLTWADPFQLQQVFLNLITNAEHAIAGRERRHIVVRTLHERGVLIVSVEDSGPGIPPKDVDRIFNPFFTTKPVGQGTGLGLSISDGIVRQHGGRIRVISGTGEGATLRVELPLAEPPAHAPEGIEGVA